MTEDEQLIEEMATVYALISARLQNDPRAFNGILLDEDICITGMILSLVDLCIGMLQVQAEEAEMDIEQLVRSMAMITRMVLPDKLKEMREESA